MAEIKWVKITTDMFDNRKIKQIRHLPEGNNIVLIWVMLLTIAGRCNASGMIFLTENIPYSMESLALELGFDQKVVQLALATLEKYGMIVCNEERFCISNWEEYQNVEGMDKIREQNRIRQKNWYDRQKSLPNVRDNVSLTEHNATDKEEDIEGDIERENILKKTLSKDSVKEKPKRFSPPTTEEVQSYCSENGYSIDAQRFVDYYTANGWMVGKNHMKDWQAAVRTWVQKDKKPEKTPERRFVPTDL